VNDLNRFTLKVGARAVCGQRGAECFLIEHKSSEVTGAKARGHTRETGHPTRVEHRHITEYRKAGAL
jgi:hypothetical protein